MHFLSKECSCFSEISHFPVMMCEKVTIIHNLTVYFSFLPCYNIMYYNFYNYAMDPLPYTSHSGREKGY